MDLATELLATAHEADIQRTARRRRLERLLATCRRRLFGVLPISVRCDPHATC